MRFSVKVSAKVCVDEIASTNVNVSQSLEVKATV